MERSDQNYGSTRYARRSRRPSSSTSSNRTNNSNTTRRDRKSLISNAIDYPVDVVQDRSSSPYCPILELPDDVFYVIFTFLSPVALCRLSRVCQRFKCLVSEDSVWLSWEKQRTVLRSRNQRCHAGIKERYRVALNWEYGHRREVYLLRHKFRLLPWLQRVENTMWMSRGNLIIKYNIKDNGQICESAGRPLRGPNTDVTRFVINNGLVVSGCRGGGVTTWEASSGIQLLHYDKVHLSDTQCVAVIDDVIVSGSKDRTVKVLSMFPDDKEKVKKCFNIEDRVWSLSSAPGTSTVAVGTACYKSTAIVLLDINSGEVLCNLGDKHKRGSGVLDMVFESPHTLLTCGHDTYLRLWDLRTHTCVSMWEDPFDSALYCLQTDGQYTMLTGTARHGLVRLWDKRHKEHVQAYYSGEQSSPVYSLAGSSHHLHIALDMGLYFVDFSIH